MNRATLPVIGPLLIVLAGSAWLLAPARAADVPPTKPQVWAVVVGIDRYEDQLIHACSTATRDARTVAGWIAKTAGWGGDHVLFMGDRGVREHGKPEEAATDLLPTRDNLDWALTAWLGHRARAGDVVVFYFAGQATVRPPKSGGLAGRGYLLPIDAAAADVDRTGWSLEDALDRSAIATRAKVVLWLDTSPRGRGEEGLPVEVKVPTGAEWLDALTRWPGVTAWL